MAGSFAARQSKTTADSIVDGHRDDGKRFVVHSDEKLTAFMELELAIRCCPSKSRFNYTYLTPQDS
jgi:hypothetical protein